MGRRRRGVIAFGVFLIIAGIIIPFLNDIYRHNLLSGGLFPESATAVLAFGVAVAILGAVVIVIGLVIKDKAETSEVPVNR